MSERQRERERERYGSFHPSIHPSRNGKEGGIEGGREGEGKKATWLGWAGHSVTITKTFNTQNVTKRSFLFIV